VKGEDNGLDIRYLMMQAASAAPYTANCVIIALTNWSGKLLLIIVLWQTSVTMR